MPSPRALLGSVTAEAEPPTARAAAVTMPTMLKHRIPSGLLMTACLLLLMWADDHLARIEVMEPGSVMLLVCVGMISLASIELALLLKAKWGHCSRLSVFFSALVGLMLVYFSSWIRTTPTAVAVLATGTAVTIFFAMFRHSFARKQTHGAAAAGASAMFALIYLGILPGIYLLIRIAGYSAFVIAAVLLIVKACDVGAYTTGKLVGRHKLIPWLSPGKTWEGLLGGMAFSAGFATLFVWWGNHYATSPQHAIALWYAPLAGAVLGALGQVGDLLASLLKRDAGIKDYAATIPGFGGVMDVADSILLVAPVAYWLLTLAPAA